MKKLYFIIISVLLLALSACSKDNDNNVSQLTEDFSFDVKSTLSPSDYLLASKKLVATVNTRATLNNEDSCHKALQPLINDGRSLRKQILEQAGSLGADSLSFLKNMSEEELASLSFVVFNLNQLAILEQQETRALSSSKLKNCVSFAVGLDAVSNLSLKGVITATTLRRALFAIGKRYLGYIGIALMIADFYDCFYG